MHCPNCGNPIEDDDLFCGECGCRLILCPHSP
ncbi:zinc-ribbon domain-containing protein, partial [Staphylococcus epidermidis]